MYPENGDGYTMGSFRPEGLARALATAAGRDGKQHAAQAAMFRRQRVVGGDVRLVVARGALGQAAQCGHTRRNLNPDFNLLASHHAIASLQRAWPLRQRRQIQRLRAIGRKG
jgi:hypothetical protein